MDRDKKRVCGLKCSKNNGQIEEMAKSSIQDIQQPKQEEERKKFILKANVTQLLKTADKETIPQAGRDKRCFTFRETFIQMTAAAHRGQKEGK